MRLAVLRQTVKGAWTDDAMIETKTAPLTDLDGIRGVCDQSDRRQTHGGASIDALDTERCPPAAPDSNLRAQWRCIGTKPSLAGVYTLGFCPVSRSKQRLDATR
jgi:hypothetical protein